MVEFYMRAGGNRRCRYIKKDKGSQRNEIKNLIRRAQDHEA